MTEPTNGISFGKFGTIKSGDNGVSRNAWSSKADDIDSKIANALFKKYDKDKNNVLDQFELSQLYDDLKTQTGHNNRIGNKEANKFVDGVEIDKEQLYNFLSKIGGKTDNVKSAIKYTGGDVRLTYEPNEDGLATEEYTMINGKSVLKEQHYQTSDANTVISYNTETGKKTNEVVSKSDGTTTIITEYEDNGTTIKSKWQKSGIVSTKLDFEHGDRPLEIHKNTQPLPTLTQITYDDDNEISHYSTYKLYEDGPNQIKILTAEDTYFEDVNDDGTVNKKLSSHLEYSYENTDGSGNLTTIRTTGEGENATRIKTTYDSNEQDKNNITSRVQIDSAGNTMTYTHNVQEGDTWYGIVAAKYGLDEEEDGKKIMEIVHQLKTSAGVSRSLTTMPETINLPPTVDLKDGSKIELKNITARVNQIHSGRTIEVPPALNPEEIPQARTFTQEEKSINPEDFKFPVKPEFADTIQTVDGKEYEYNNDGRVIHIYDGNTDFRIFYSDDDGSIDYLYKYIYKDSSRTDSIETYYYSCRTASLFDYEKYDDEQYSQINYSADDGKVYSMLKKIKEGDITKTIHYYGDGSVNYITYEGHDSNGNYVDMEFDKNGKITSDLSY